MDNFVSLSDSDRVADVKEQRAHYKFRERTEKKRVAENRVRTDRYKPYK